MGGGRGGTRANMYGLKNANMGRVFYRVLGGVLSSRGARGGRGS
jgi:hypothetical protein